jgi:hypothetical protein
MLAPAQTARERVAASEAVAGEADPDQLRTDEPVRMTSTQVTAVFAGGSSTPEIHASGFTPKPGAIVAEQTVGPTGAPHVNSGGGNDCTPGNEALTWNVIDDGANWRANVTALQVSAEMHITPWTSAPSAMTVPNTANPVDGGNINNTAGSANRWQAAIDDMADYDNVTGGGAGPNWHSTAASTAHEWAHWNQDYLADTIPTANWTGANQDIDALTVPKSANADTAAARTALEPLVSARFRTFVRAATARWNVLIGTLDKPGKGGRGYAAGMAVLNGLISSVRAYAAAKGWNAPPAPPAAP